MMVHRSNWEAGATTELRSRDPNYEQHDIVLLQPKDPMELIVKRNRGSVTRG